MKIKFEKDLDYQLEAINAVTDLFSGQEKTTTTFTVEKHTRGLQLGIIENDLGIGNALRLLPEKILENLNKIQLRNALPKTEVLKEDNYNFSVEMETGTGKTYVYLRSIMELHKKYGFLKYIIVVPSKAIKEGVNKTLEITRDHFRELYENVPYDFFIYDSKKIDAIRNFAVGDTIQIMIIAIDSFNKDTNVINQERDQANGYRPIDYIKQCNPVVIVDEPQNMETDIAKKAIEELNPLCTLRYSATHKELYNQVFKLNSIDAYERKLVKQIEVASIAVPESANTEYIKVTSVKASKTKTGINAKLELDVKVGKTVKRKEVTIKHGDDIAQKAKRDIYDGYLVNEITYDENDPGRSFVDLGKVRLTLGQVNGGQDPDVIKRLQIRKTIKEHFDKQLKLNNRDIKVLSLFFIDKVANYRKYNPETGEPEKGKYAIMFEEEYSKLLELAKYQTLGDHSVPFYQRAAKAHDGYFAQDKKKSKSGVEYYELKDSKEKTTNADEETFNKIMRDKEKLLSFSEPLSFIFSHSALKEGWDNPNVFQICTLNETSSEMKKRQEIGRGLRIAVNQDGQRVRGFNVNTLTVMANESYEDFVNSLQNEMREDEGINFGVVEKTLFSNIIKHLDNTKESYLGYEASEEIFDFLVKEEYISEEGHATNKLKQDLTNNTLVLPEKYQELKRVIINKLKLSIGKLTIKNAAEKKEIKVKKEVLLSDEFKELWDKIKFKTTYEVNFDGEQLKEKCIQKIDEELYIPEDQLTYNKRRIAITGGGIQDEPKFNINEVEKIGIISRYKLPDIISYLQNETNLTRRTIVEILTKTRTLDSFKKNPQSYLEQVTDIIKRTMRTFIVDGITYHKIGDTEYYSQELFEESELFGYLKSEMNKEGNMLSTDKTPYTDIVVDSDVERNFALELEANENIILYTKLPGWFKISTPLGSYNPDWAVLVRPDLNKEEEKLYFIVETKGSIDMDALRETEKLKIKCGKKHFKAISNEIKFEVTNDFKTFKRKLV